MHDRPSLPALIASWNVIRRNGFADEPAVIAHDLGWMRSRLQRIAAAYPVGTLHAVAIKANPVVEVLRAAVLTGAGLEAASWEEVSLALAAGCPPERIIFDSPAKTVDELARALAAGIAINANSVGELDRIAGLLQPTPRKSWIGLRINPQVGAGHIAATSVASRQSRFGVPIEDATDVEHAFRRFPWLVGLHVHVGSQGCSLEQLTEGACRIRALRERIDGALGSGRVQVVDLGGGLPAAYDDDARPATPEQYVGLLRQKAPGLFDGVQLVTEYGRWVQASAGFTVTRVETVRTHPSRVATLLVGADLLMRRAYMPELWHHDFIVLDPTGAMKEGERAPWTLGGPLCFAGDVLAHDLPLPMIDEGDQLLIRDTGAYTLAMWSRHCSRGIPAVVGIDGDDVTLLRERESPADVVAFWSRGVGARLRA